MATNESAIPGASVQSVTLAGQRFVIVPEGEYRRLREAAEGGSPQLPPADARGYYPAVETMRALLARDILRQRRALGLSQAELARRAGIRPETIIRLEQGKHSASVPTVDKIDRALRAAEAERAEAARTSPPTQPATRPRRRNSRKRFS
jgi:DNA-binding XRE family transcriptional regulator